MTQLPDDLTETLARAHDAEDAAQRGEPSPWDIDDDPSMEDKFRADRIACFRAALSALDAAGYVVAPKELIDEQLHRAIEFVLNIPIGNTCALDEHLRNIWKTMIEQV